MLKNGVSEIKADWLISLVRPLSGSIGYELANETLKIPLWTLLCCLSKALFL